MAEGYRPFLIRKLKEGSIVRDTTEWGIVVRSVPFKLRPEIKDMVKRDWKDQDGDDEFIPETPVFKAYTMDVDFVFKGDHGTGNSKIGDFIDYLSNGGEFSIYDSYTKIGRTNVRYATYKDEGFRRREGKRDIIKFSVSLKVNSPAKNITL